MKFGDGFNASIPTDGDYVRSETRRQMAVELRDLKVRIVDFFGDPGNSQGTLEFNRASDSGALVLV
jgi:hypothetical protein